MKSEDKTITAHKNGNLVGSVVLTFVNTPKLNEYFFQELHALIL